MKTLLPFLSAFKRTLVISLFTLFPLSSFASSTSADECPAFSVEKEIKLIWYANRFSALKDSKKLYVTSTPSTPKFHHGTRNWGYQVKDKSSGANFSYELALRKRDKKKLQNKYHHLSGVISTLDCNGEVIGTAQEQIANITPKLKHKHQGKVFHITVHDKNGNEIGSANYQYKNTSFVLLDANGTSLLSAKSSPHHHKQEAKWVIHINDPHFDPRIAFALGYYAHERQKFHVFY